MTIGENIKNCRQRLGFSQIDLAEKSGLNQGQISEYENGRVKPGIDTLIKLADVLAVSVAVLDENLRSIPEIKNSVSISGGKINGGTFIGRAEKVSMRSSEIETIAGAAVENFRSRLISEIIRLEIDAETQAAVLKLINNLR